MGLPELALIPDDPGFVAQWHLNNLIFPGVDLNVTGVWDDYQGSEVVIGIVDTGIDYTHPDLAANYRADLDYDARDGDSDSFASAPNDDHGTVVSGVVAASLGNGDVVGVAPAAEITGFRVGFGSDGTTAQFVTQLQNMAGVDIANNSWGWGGYFYDNFATSTFAASGAAIQNAAETGRGGLGTVVTFAAGNSAQSGDDVNHHSFQSSRFTIATGAIEQDGDIAYFSTPGAAVLVSAPGSGIYSTDVQGGGGYSAGDYVTLNGTSFAAPGVAGVAALMLDANPDLGYRDVQEILTYSAVNPKSSDTGWQTNGADNWNGGGLTFSHDYGFGLVDAHAAVRLAETWEAQSTEANVVVSPHNNLTTSTFIGDHSTITKTAFVSTAMDIDQVEVHLKIDHTWIGDLTVTLTSPEGTTSTLVNQPWTSQDDIDFTFNTVANWGETGQGTWTLSVSDSFTLDTGSLRDWDLTFFGDAITGDDSYIFTDQWARHGGESSRQTLTDASGVDTLNFASITQRLDLDLTPGSTNSLLGHALNIAAGSVFENVYGGDAGDVISGNDADNLLYGMRGDDVLSGGSGSDFLIGGAGSDTLDGGDGIDTAGYSGNLADYAITRQNNVVTVATGGDTDLLSDIEFLAFADQTTTATNQAPAITSDGGGDTASLSVAENTTAVTTVTATDPESDTVAFSITGGADAGKFAIDANLGTLSFSTAPDFEAPGDVDGDNGYVVTIEANDGNGNLDSQTLTVSVTNVNEAPTASDETVTTNEDTAHAFAASEFNFADVDAGDGLETVEVVTLPGAGALKLSGAAVSAGDVITVANINAGNLTFTPANDANGNGYANFTFKVGDGDLFSDTTATMTINVTPVNDAPSFTVGAHQTVMEDVGAVSVTGFASGASAGPGDEAGQALTFTITTDNDALFAVLPGIDAATGDLSYTPADDANGVATVSMTLSDDGGTADGGADTSSAQQFAITVAPVNDAPVAGGESYTTALYVQLTDVLAATDVDGDVLSYGLSSAPAHGTVTVASDGGFVYTPAAAFYGSDSFDYTVSDGVAATSGTASVTVAPTNLVGGGAGDDVVTGGAGDDVVFGYAGDDTLYGGAGDDRYVFCLGDGTDMISDDATTTTRAWVSSGHWVRFGRGGEGRRWVDTSHWKTKTVAADGGDDTLSFDSGIAIADVALSLSGGDLVVGITDPGNPDVSFAALTDRITMTNWTAVYERIETLGFADGTTVDITGLSSTLEALGDTGGVTLTGSGGMDWISGGSGDDVLAGGGGDDVLIGGAGNDTAQYSGAYGSYTVTVGSDSTTVSGSEGSDTLAGVERLAFSDFTVFADGTNNAPLPSADTATAAKDTAVTILASDLLSNDVDADGDTLTLVSVQNAIDGTAVLDVNGDVVFTPAADFNGTATFEYTVSDGSDTATQSVAVSIQNLAPVPGSDTVSATEDTALTILASALLANDVDADGDALTLVSVQNAIGGSVVLNGSGDVVFTPVADFNGAAAFDYTVTDGGGTASQAVTVTVAPVNDAPVAGGESFTTALDVQLNGVLSATDVDGDVLSYGLSSAPANGTVTVASDGGFVYTPAAAFFGSDSFDYTVSDGVATASGTASVTVAPANLVGGSSGDDVVTGSAGDDVLYGYAGDDRLYGGAGDDRYVFRPGDGTDMISDDATTTTRAWVSSGHWVRFGRGGEGRQWVDTSHWTTKTVAADGGNDTLSFDSGIAIADVALSLSGGDLVVGITDPGNPDASFAALTDRVTMTNWTAVYERIETLGFADGTTVDITGLSSTLEALGDTGGVTLTGSGGMDWISGGSGDDILAGGGGNDVLIGGAGNDTAQYSGAYGSYTVTVGSDSTTVSGSEGSDTLAGVERLAFSDFTVFADGTNNAPLPSADTATAAKDTAVTILASDLLSNDVDADGDTLTLVSVQNAIDGTAVLDVNGDVVFTPAADFNGTATFEYTVSDGSATASQSVAVSIQNLAPVPGSDTVSATEDTALTILASALLANDVDADGDALTLVSVQNAIGGSVVLNGSGDVVFTPVADFNGAAAFDYTVTDGGGTASQAVTVTVAPVNDAPVAGGESFTTALDVQLNGVLSATDVDGDVLSYGLSSAPTNGTVTVASDGGFVYTPAAAFFGSDSFDYTVSDGVATASGTASVTVAPANLVGGGPGDDVVTGSADDDVLYGYAGDDRLYGGAGDDRYVFRLGDGADMISDDATTTTRAWVSSGHWVRFGRGGEDRRWVDTSHWTTKTVAADGGDDTLSFDSGIAIADVALSLSGDDLVVGITDPGNPDVSFAALTDRITMTNWTAVYERIETLGFADGTTVDITGLSSTLEALGDTGGVTLTGSGGMDWMSGGSGDDVLAGGGGNDVLIGGTGDDLFVFTDGDGADTVSDFTPGAGSDDVINLIDVSSVNAFSEVLAAASQVSDDTLIDFGGGDQITLLGVNVGDLYQDDFLL